MLLHSEIQEIQDRISTLKETFARTIADTELPLEKRWELFVKAPSFLKEHSTWTVDFKAFPCEILWYDDFYYERYETVKTVGIVERIVEDFLYADRYNGKSRFQAKGFTNKTIDDLKEEILSTNLGSFKYDW